MCNLSSCIISKPQFPYMLIGGLYLMMGKVPRCWGKGQTVGAGREWSGVSGGDLGTLRQLPPKPGPQALAAQTSRRQSHKPPQLER